MANKFHFKEIDWIIYFPSNGNEGREILDYGVAYRDRVNQKTQPGPKINLSDVLIKDAIKEKYPHTIAFFQEASGKGDNWVPDYIEERKINDEKELLDWVKEIDKK